MKLPLSARREPEFAARPGCTRGQANWALAEQEAQRSLQISELLHLGKNLAFCRKCLGRLKRLLAEAETDKDCEARSLRGERDTTQRGTFGFP